MTRRRLATVLLVVVMCYLAASAPPVGAANAAAPELDVVSSHSTETDFNGADTLQNVTVKGSGSDASVALEKGRFVDGFEREAADAGVPDNWEETTSFDSINVTTDRAFEGSQSTRLEDSTAGEMRPSEQPYSSNTTQNVTAALYSASQTSEKTVSLKEGGDLVVSVAIRNGDLQYFNGSSWVTISTVPDANEWVEITITDIDPSTDTFAVDWETDTDSGMSTGLDARGVIDNGFDETAVFVGGGVAFVDSVQIGDPRPDGEYVGANHTGSAIESGWANLTLDNATADVTWQGWTGSSWADVNSSTFTATGNHTLDVSTASHSKWRVNVTFRAQPGVTTAEIHDEGILFDSRDPEIDNSSASPTGDQSSEPSQLSIDVSDPDFATTQGDSVTVEFFKKGPNDGSFSSEGTATLSGNGTASVSLPSSLNGGTHEWWVRATDDYGNTATSDNFSYRIPAQLEIRNVSDPSQLVNNTNVEVQFFGSDTTISRTVSDGTVNMSGLPADEKFVARADAGSYFARTTLIDSLYEQQTIYLLPDSADGVEIVFQVDDATGQFTGNDVELIVQRPINRSGTTTWKTAIGDRLSASGELATVLERNQRYRIIVRNDDTSRILGSYTPTSPQNPEVLPIGDVDVQGTPQHGAAFGATMQNETAGGQRVVQLAYVDSADATTQLQYEIVRADNQSKVLVANTTITNPNQRVVFTESVPATAPANVSYLVKWHADRDGEPDVGGVERVGALRQIGDEFALDDNIMMWLSYAAIVLTAGLTVIVDSRLAAIGTVGIAALLTYLGFVYINPIVLGLAGSTAILFVVGRSST